MLGKRPPVTGISRAVGGLIAGVTAFAALPAGAEKSQEELAKESQNPVAALISLPLKLDYDRDIGPAEQGNKTVLTVQPVIPFSIGNGWNLISRTLVPLISQQDVVPGAGTQSGLGDISQQFYFSPEAPTAGGWIWGVGPLALLRTGADNLTASKWGLGPTGVLLKQEHGWTYGLLVNHLWSVAGSAQARDISATYVQPVLSYTTKTYTTFGINTESTYNWETRQWSVPVNLTLSQILKIGGQPLSLQAGVRYWADTPDGIGPKGWGFRFQLTFLFPK
jgi:hypothetical protein